MARRSRRDFLRTGGVGALTLGLAACTAPRPLAPTAVPPAARPAARCAPTRKVALTGRHRAEPPADDCPRAADHTRPNPGDPAAPGSSPDGSAHPGDGSIERRRRRPQPARAVRRWHLLRSAPQARDRAECGPADQQPVRAAPQSRRRSSTCTTAGGVAQAIVGQQDSRSTRSATSSGCTQSTSYKCLNDVRLGCNC